MRFINIPVSIVQRSISLIICGIAYLSIFAISPVMAGPGDDREITPVSTLIDWYARLQSIRLEPSTAASVSGVVLKRENASFYLKSGTIYFCTPVNNIVTGAVFKGEGTFSFQPDNEMEKEQVRRFLKTHEIETPVRYIYFRFSDSTYAELREQVQFQPEKKKIDKDVLKFYSSIKEYLYKELHYDTAFRILWDLVHPERGGYFFADCQKAVKDRMNVQNFQLTIEPRAFENVALTFYRKYRAGMPHHLVCSFRSKSSSSVVEPQCPTERGFKIRKYNMDVTIEGNGTAAVEADILLNDQRGGTQFLIFRLSEDLSVDSITNDQNCSVLFFRQEKGDGALRIILNTPMKKEECRHLRITYNGKLLKRLWSKQWILPDFLYWYPRYGNNFRSFYNVTFHTPHYNTLVATGECVKEWKDKELYHSQWIQDDPVFIFSFNLGDFEMETYEGKNLPVIRVYNDPQISRGTQELIGEEICKCLEFYQEKFAPFPFQSITVSQVPKKPDIGYPGLINLSTKSIEDEEYGNEEIVIAHEAAHQWWGHFVNWRTYHDIWLSEGFAEYSALLYLEQKKNDNKLFNQALKNKIGRILFNMKSIRKAGPIWMGTRLSTELITDYNILIYAKGAYILHMIRYLLYDCKTGDDEKFFAMLRDYAQTFAWKSASTMEFQSLVEKHFNDSLQWFFDQWVYGTAIPTYYFSHRAKRETDNTWEIIGAVRQEEVPHDFKMFVPVTVNWSHDKKRTEKILVDRDKTEFQIKGIPEKPSEVIFNDFNAVLCRVKYEN